MSETSKKKLCTYVIYEVGYGSYLKTHEYCGYFLKMAIANRLTD